MAAPQFIAAVILVVIVIGNLGFTFVDYRRAWDAHRRGFPGAWEIGICKSIPQIINLAGALVWATLLTWGGFWA